MVALADAVSKVTPLHGRKKRSERGDFVKWAEFEPYYNQLRTSTAAGHEEMAKVIGYNSGSAFTTWKRDDTVPIVAFNSIRWVLHELHLPKPDPVPAKEQATCFDFEELAVLFSAVRDMPVHEVARKGLLGKIAKGLSAG